MDNEFKNKRLPYITISIIIINIIYFIVIYARGALENSMLLMKYGASIPPFDIQGDYYRLLTSAFMHFDLKHLANNMIMLYFVGEYVEEALGKWKYAICYLLCAVGGNLVSNLYYISADEIIIAMGASGAVFGLAGALDYIVIRNKGHYKNLSIQRVIIFLILCIYSGVSNSGINNAAHVGGVITGFLTAILLYRRKERDSDFIAMKNIG